MFVFLHFVELFFSIFFHLKKFHFINVKNYLFSLLKEIVYSFFFCCCLMIFLYLIYTFFILVSLQVCYVLPATGFSSVFCYSSIEDCKDLVDIIGVNVKISNVIDFLIY